MKRMYHTIIAEYFKSRVNVILKHCMSMHATFRVSTGEDAVVSDGVVFPNNPISKYLQ